MWIDPANPNSFTALTVPKACGLTPFCSPMKPCGLTPMCGKTPAPNPQMIAVDGMGINGMPLGMQNPQFNQVLPPSIVPNTGTPVIPPNGSPQQNGTPPKPTLAGPSGTLISMGIVPGVSTITSGGLVAAVGVKTPAGMMTPVGVQMPNGAFNNTAVLRACGLTPNCNAARPCGATPNCGGLVTLASVSNNAVSLASALSSAGAQGGIINAGGGMVPVGGNINGTLVNPISGQPHYGLSMNGIPQVGYPPIGYTPSGYSPKYPRFDGLGIGMSPEQYAQMLQMNEEAEEPEPQAESPVTKSQMPVPRFHPVPSKPAFQRSEGIPVGRKTADGRRQTAEIIDGNEGSRITEEELKRAYLEGMAAAMEEVENELAAVEEKREQKRETAQMQAKVLNQARELQERIAAQNTVRVPVQVPVQIPAPVLANKSSVRSTVQTASAAVEKKQDENMLTSAANYVGSATNFVGGKIKDGIGNIPSFGKKNTPANDEKILQLKDAQQKILQQQTVLQRQPPKPLTISRTAAQIRDENEISQAGYTEP